MDLLTLVALVSCLSVPWALAGESQAPTTADEPAQPVVSATVKSPAPERALAHVLESPMPTNSVDFLMEEPPLTQSTAMDTPAPSLTPETTPVIEDPDHIPFSDFLGLLPEKPDEVAMLVSEECSQSGNAVEGTSSCARVYSNGHRATVLTQNAHEGDELKQQTVIEEFDATDTLLFRKTIRHRVDYNYLNDQKAKEKEFFDIIYQPAGKKTTRELMVYEYFLDTGKAKSLAWTQYKQIGNEARAELVYHSLLRYGDDGSPDRGLAERWDHGKKADTYMNWSRRSKGYATLDEETWNQWESWIRTVSLQAYLP
jgi:hypothetical protein